MYWIGFILLLHFKFPDYISKYLLDAFMAFGKNTNERLYKAGYLAKQYINNANNAAR
jgi:hypothetical protein